jgi:hypothetical protein
MTHDSTRSDTQDTTGSATHDTTGSGTHDSTRSGTHETTRSGINDTGRSGTHDTIGTHNTIGTQDVIGIDHTGILTRDLGKLSAGFEALGFTLSAPSRHLLGVRPGERPTLGNTANRCVVFGTSFIELLGIIDPSAPDPWGVNQVPDGFRIFYVGTDDADAVDRRLGETGVPTLGVRSLEREIDTLDGPRRVRARGLHIHPSSTPEGFIGVAQHLTPQYIHQPRYLTHPNGARGIGSVLIVAEDALVEEYVDRYARILQTIPHLDGPRHVLDVPGGYLTTPDEQPETSSEHASVPDAQAATRDERAPVPGGQVTTPDGQVPVPVEHAATLGGQVPVPVEQAATLGGQVPVPVGQAATLGGQAKTPGGVREMPRGRLEIIRLSAVADVLPDEPVPAPSYLAAMSILVEDVQAARSLVEGNGIPTRTTQDGFFVSARDAYGAGLFFTAS